MMTPFFKFGFFNDEVSLIIAVVIGIGFGFFLERAGFGSARKLAAQFYFKDMAVFKVMFTAIITAMLGLFYFSWLGWIDLSQVYIGNTYLVPMLLGGFILGVGFVIGGYCPGTSAVACATGKIDGYFFAFGVMFGIFAFGEVFPWISDFFNGKNHATGSTECIFWINCFPGGYNSTRWIYRSGKSGKINGKEKRGEVNGKYL